MTLTCSYDELFSNEGPNVEKIVLNHPPNELDMFSL